MICSTTYFADEVLRGYRTSLKSNRWIRPVSQELGSLRCYELASGSLESGEHLGMVTGLVLGNIVVLTEWEATFCWEETHVSLGSRSVCKKDGVLTVRGHRGTQPWQADCLGPVSCTCQLLWVLGKVVFVSVGGWRWLEGLQLSQMGTERNWDIEGSVQDPEKMDRNTSWTRG